MPRHAPTCLDMPRHVPTSAKPIRFSKFFFKRGSGLGNRSSSTMDRPWVRCQISTQENTVPQMPQVHQVQPGVSLKDLETSRKSFGRFQSLAVLPTKTHGWTLHKVPWSIQASATALLESSPIYRSSTHRLHENGVWDHGCQLTFQGNAPRVSTFPRCETRKINLTQSDQSHNTYQHVTIRYTCWIMLTPERPSLKAMRMTTLPKATSISKGYPCADDNRLSLNCGRLLLKFADDLAANSYQFNTKTMKEWCHFAKKVSNSSFVQHWH